MTKKKVPESRLTEVTVEELREVEGDLKNALLELKAVLNVLEQGNRDKVEGVDGFVGFRKGVTKVGRFLSKLVGHAKYTGPS